MTIFKRGYDAVATEKKRQEENRALMGAKLWRFFLAKDGDEADLRFLTEEPINYYEHTVQVNRNGKTMYDNVTCIGDGCPLCEDGERATFKGAYLIVDRRKFTYKKDGKDVEGKDQVRLYVQGTRVLSQLDRISSKYGLSNREVTLVRLGSGTSTTYTVERGEKSELTSKEIEQFLPENLRKEYDGTMESLYAMVEKQIMFDIPEEVRSDYLDDEEVEEPKEVKRGLIDIDEDDYNDEVEVEDKPVGLKKALKLNKPRENSIKKLLKAKNDDIPF